MSVSDFAAKIIGEKKLWKAYKARTTQLLEETAAEGQSIQESIGAKPRIPGP